MRKSVVTVEIIFTDWEEQDPGRTSIDTHVYLQLDKVHLIDLMRMANAGIYELLEFIANTDKNGPKLIFKTKPK